MAWITAMENYSESSLVFLAILNILQHLSHSTWAFFPHMLSSLSHADFWLIFSLFFFFFFWAGLYNSLLSISLTSTPVTVCYNRNEPVILLTPLFLLFMDQISWHRALRWQLSHWVTKVEECPLPFKGRKSGAKAFSQVGLQLNWRDRCWPTGAN